MTHVMVEELNTQRLGAARADAEHQRRVQQARRAATSRRWLRVANYARERATQAAE